MLQMREFPACAMAGAEEKKGNAIHLGGLTLSPLGIWCFDGYGSWLAVVRIVVFVVLFESICFTNHARTFGHQVVLTYGLLV